MVRRTFVVVFPCPCSRRLGAATLRPFRWDGKTQVTSGSVDLFPWPSDEFCYTASLVLAVCNHSSTIALYLQRFKKLRCCILF